MKWKSLTLCNLLISTLEGTEFAAYVGHFWLLFFQKKIQRWNPAGILLASTAILRRTRVLLTALGDTPSATMIDGL